MMNIIIVLVTITAALLIGQVYPLLGGLIATFPIKIVGYAFGSSQNVEFDIKGLLLGSIASLVFVIVMQLTIGYGIYRAIAIGLVAWGLVALVGSQLNFAWQK